jgi:hypothetical protein
VVVDHYKTKGQQQEADGVPVEYLGFFFVAHCICAIRKACREPGRIGLLRQRAGILAPGRLLAIVLP